MDDGHSRPGADDLANLEAWSVEDVRARRAECVGVETGLSYLRRMVQGRLDIVRSEQQRRADGGPSTDLPELIGQLPDILAEHRNPGGPGRLPQTLDPPEPDPVLVARLESLAGVGRLTALADLDDAGVEALAGSLGDLERDVSGRRREMFTAIDALQAELTRRYQSGEADVETLLGDS